MISLNVVIYDESNVIDRCIRSAIRYVDEIILLVDTGCRFTNRLKKYTSNIFYSDLSGSIVEHHRNKLIEASTHPWILVLDPDEFLDPRLGPELRESSCKINLTSQRPFDGFYLPRFNVTYTEDYELIVGEDYPDWNLRFFRKHARYSGVIYEDCKSLSTISNPLGLSNVGYITEGLLLHDKTYEDIEEVRRTIALYKKWRSKTDN